MSRTIIAAFVALVIAALTAVAFVVTSTSYSNKVRNDAEGQLRRSYQVVQQLAQLEAIDVATTLDQPVPFAKEELFRIPLWGRAARAYGAIEVARDDGAAALRRMLAEARRFSTTGRPLVIFPEGTRVPHGERPPLRAGFAGLYKLLGLPVVPVAVDSGPLYHRMWKRPGTITLRFGEPIPPGLPRAEAEARVHAAINTLNP